MGSRRLGRGRFVGLLCCILGGLGCVGRSLCVLRPALRGSTVRMLICVKSSSMEEPLNRIKGSLTYGQGQECKACNHPQVPY